MRELWHDSNHHNINTKPTKRATKKSPDQPFTWIAIMSNLDGPDDGPFKETTKGTFVRARPKSVYSARVLVFEDADEQTAAYKPQTNKATGATCKSSPERTKQIESHLQQHSLPSTTSSVYRKTAYQTQHSHSLRSNSGLDNISNMVRVRNSTLGKSAPSLSASMVCSHIFLSYLSQSLQKFTQSFHRRRNSDSAQRNRLHFHRVALSLRFIVLVSLGMLLPLRRPHRHDHIHRFPQAQLIVHALVHRAKCTSRSLCPANGSVAVVVMVVDGQWHRCRRLDMVRHREALICR